MRRNVPPSFQWNAQALRYVGPDGRFVSRIEVRKALDAALLKEQKNIVQLAKSLQRSKITLAQWQEEMRITTKSIHLYSAALGRGGFEQMSASDWGRIGPTIRNQYKYIDRFALQIENGYTLDGRFLRRVELYAQSGRVTYHVQDGRMHKDNGYEEERSILHAADHCDECVGEADAGWQPIGTMIPIGERQCLSRCACSVEYR